MSNLRDLKTKRISINKTRKVTRAMEMVSAVKMRKAQERALKGRAYAASAIRVLGSVSEASDVSHNPLTCERQSGLHGLILITSDKGLAGALNTAVIKKAEAFLKNYKKEDIVCIAIGRRGADYLRARGYKIIHKEDNRKDDVSIDSLSHIQNMVIPMHEKEETCDWHIAYMHFSSIFSQVPFLRRALPFDYAHLSEVVESLIPESKRKTSETLIPPASYTIEPYPQAIFDTIIPRLANVLLYHSLLEAKASEHSARMVAMKSATDKAKEMSHNLSLEFNKARQAAITREMSEIASGIEAMK